MKDKRLNPDTYPSQNQKRIHKWLITTDLWEDLVETSIRDDRGANEVAADLIDDMPEHTPEGDVISLYCLSNIIKRIRAERQKRVSGRKSKPGSYKRKTD